MKKIIIFLIVMVILVSFAVSMTELISENPKFNVHKVTEDNQEVLKFEVKQEIAAHELIKEAVKIQEADDVKKG